MYKLLIVDDEHIEREALKYVVTRECRNIRVVDVAVNGKEAIEKVKQHLPDILFMDIKMPGINGLEAAKEIKEIQPECKIVFISAFDYFNYAQKAIEVGAIDFVLKPVSNDRLIESINRATKMLDAEIRQKPEGNEETEKVHLEPNRLTNAQENQFNPHEKEKELCRKLVMDTDESFLVLAEELFEWILSTSSELGEVKTKVYSLLVAINRTVLPGVIESQSGYYNRLQPVKSIEGLLSILKQITSEMKQELDLKQINQTGSLIEEVCRYIQSNYMKEIRLEEMANMIGYSSHYFSKMFKLHKKQNFIDYLIAVRVGKAKELLSDSRFTIKEIANFVGYEDQNYFTRVFKKIEDSTPSEYRNKIVLRK
jgi:two-component system, response regulator YesN